MNAPLLSFVLQNLDNDEIKSFGFDLSWSRVAFAKKWLQNQGLLNTTLCTGSLVSIPFAENSIDVVYTAHSIEPNGGNEEPILRELYRVTRQFLIILEPDYENASNEAKQRMEFHGYCRNIKGICKELSFDIIEHKLFPFTLNPLNPSYITIIRKNESPSSIPSYVLACPKYYTALEEIGGMMFSPEALSVYPIIGGIPCLRIENAIFASKFREVICGQR